MRSAALGLIIVALLGPSFGETTKEIKTIGKDIFICLDLSESMNAFDVQPTRLEKMKFELRNIVEAFNSDRIGLIMFSNEAFMQCPLTYDKNALNLFIQTLHTGLVPNTGTDFGPPLKMAFEKLDREETVGGIMKSQIILLISDGEDFGEETDEIAEDIEDAGIRLFTLGVGTATGSKIQTTRGFKRNQDGTEVISQLNSRSLEELADKTGGKYFEINGQQNDVERLINAINAIEGEMKDARQVDAASNKYAYFLMAGLALLLLDILFQIKVFKI
jgi:Ca-activated chloride channel family protein